MNPVSPGAPVAKRIERESLGSMNLDGRVGDVQSEAEAIQHKTHT
jgi:hypothetical protein